VTRPRSLTTRPAFPVCVGIVILLAMLAIASAAAAKGAPRFHRGHLPAIGEIKLTTTKHGLAEITVPVHYTQALAGRATGLETAEVTLHLAGKLKSGRAIGETFTRTHHHTLVGTGLVVDDFRLDRRLSHWLLSRPHEEQGRLVRVDVRHRIKTRPGTKPLYEKVASLNMATSHRARPQGEDVELTMTNDTDEPIKTAAEPDLCMYTRGEEGSELNAFTTLPNNPLPPGGTIEARIEGSGNVFDRAVYEAGSDKGAGEWFDWVGFKVGIILESAEAELGPLIDAMDLAENCESQASTFQIVAANESGEASSLGAWVVTGETCRTGCVQTNLPTAYEALGVQNYGGGGYGPGEWAEDTTDFLTALVGGWHGIANGGKVVQDQGLHWNRQELPEVEEGHVWGLFTTDTKAFELSIHEGSSPSGFSGG
jgi:hypothetical protein